MKNIKAFNNAAKEDIKVFDTNLFGCCVTEEETTNKGGILCHKECPLSLQFPKPKKTGLELWHTRRLLLIRSRGFYTG